jgi:hypothetical protein
MVAEPRHPYYAIHEVETRSLRGMTEPALRRHVQTAVKKAVEMGLAAEVRRMAHGHYLVPSVTKGNVTYVVTGKGQTLDCTCEAGDHLPYCVHRAAVAIRRLFDAGVAVEIGADGVAHAVTRVRIEDAVFPPDGYPHLLPGVREIE